ncbi:hypothetical protein F2Q69_00048366 [Brassica cretica]|uniref:Uncharacterized protein n=1 Tax=Brassica cretica TaxID=69181 RepID=A0A8S9PR32_BRACR|nr:hypothetical protein F2Q69_00048366 [Brassica cretica]
MDFQGWDPEDFRNANWWEIFHYEDFGNGWEQKESRIERRDLMDPRRNRWKNGRSTLGRSVDILAWLPTLTKILRLVSLNQVQSPSYCVDITHSSCYQGRYGFSLSKIGDRGSRPLQDHNGCDGFKRTISRVLWFASDSGKETHGSTDGLIKTSQGMQLADQFWLNADCVLVWGYGKF